ncbi:hypothetical protein GJ496_010725 [Pomphorhynchus laevis]|nr:hypothetical protein GJ496_010725 [Pomphorhynchus laevis]
MKLLLFCFGRRKNNKSKSAANNDNPQLNNNRDIENENRLFDNKCKGIDKLNCLHRTYENKETNTCPLIDFQTRIRNDGIPKYSNIVIKSIKMNKYEEDKSQLHQETKFQSQLKKYDDNYDSSEEKSKNNILTECSDIYGYDVSSKIECKKTPNNIDIPNDRCQLSCCNRSRKQLYGHYNHIPIEHEQGSGNNNAGKYYSNIFVSRNKPPSIIEANIRYKRNSDRKDIKSSSSLDSSIEEVYIPKKAAQNVFKSERPYSKEFLIHSVRSSFKQSGLFMSIEAARSNEHECRYSEINCANLKNGKSFKTRDNYKKHMFVESSSDNFDSDTKSTEKPIDDSYSHMEAKTKNNSQFPNRESAVGNPGKVSFTSSQHESIQDFVLQYPHKKLMDELHFHFRNCNI